ncbi:MAG: histidine kinase [Alphaproteobacteria bacterium]|nr:MAG: histidine kinase [Alphaproteobacteria bacterium]
MSGRAVVAGLLGFAAVFAVALWWFQTRAHYREVSGLAAISVAGRMLPVAEYRGLDGNSPLKLRGCMRLDPAALDGLPPAPDAAPLGTPAWFDCFDPEAIAADLAAGRARAVLAAADQPQDFDIILAYYPDGRAYLWRQLNAKFRD